MSVSARIEMDEFSFCENVHGIGPWHIRRLGPNGRMLGGGIDTPFLCRKVITQGWDLSVIVNDHHLKHCCDLCAEQYRHICEGGDE